MNADIVKRVDVIEAKLDEHIKESSDEMMCKRQKKNENGIACVGKRRMAVRLSFSIIEEKE